MLRADEDVNAEGASILTKERRARGSDRAVLGRLLFGRLLELGAPMKMTWELIKHRVDYILKQAGGGDWSELSQLSFSMDQLASGDVEFETHDKGLSGRLKSSFVRVGSPCGPDGEHVSIGRCPRCRRMVVIQGVL